MRRSRGRYFKILFKFIGLKKGEGFDNKDLQTKPYHSNSFNYDDRTLEPMMRISKKGNMLPTKTKFEKLTPKSMPYFRIK